MPHSGQKKIKEIGQTFCCNLKSACVKAIWDLFPQNERQVTKIHFQDMTRFKMVYYMSWLLPYLRSKTIFTLSNSFVFYWFLKCSMSHTSFSSLATCRSFCDNRSHMLLFKSKNKHIKKKTFHCCRRHNLPFLSTIIPSTSPQLSTDIRALWSTDALVIITSDFYTHNTFNPFHNYLQLGLLALCLWFYSPIDDLRPSVTCPKPQTFQIVCNSVSQYVL